MTWRLPEDAVTLTRSATEPRSRPREPDISGHKRARAREVQSRLIPGGWTRWRVIFVRAREVSGKVRPQPHTALTRPDVLTMPGLRSVLRNRWVNHSVSRRRVLAIPAIQLPARR